MFWRRLLPAFWFSLFFRNFGWRFFVKETHPNLGQSCLSQHISAVWVLQNRSISKAKRLRVATMWRKGKQQVKSITIPSGDTSLYRLLFKPGSLYCLVMIPFCSGPFWFTNKTYSPPIKTSLSWKLSRRALTSSPLPGWSSSLDELSEATQSNRCIKWGISDIILVMYSGIF